MRAPSPHRASTSSRRSLRRGAVPAPAAAPRAAAPQGAPPPTPAHPPPGGVLAGGDAAAPRPALGQQGSRRGADARGRAGDEDPPPFDVHPRHNALPMAEVTVGIDIGT